MLHSSPSSGATVRATRLLTTIGLAAVGYVFLWQGHEHLVQAQAVTGSTFVVSQGDVARFHLLFLLAGLAFGAAYLVNRSIHSTPRAGAWLLPALPLLLLAVVWDWHGPGLLPDSLMIRLLWVTGVEVQAVAAALGGILLAMTVGPAVIGAASSTNSEVTRP